MKKVQRFLKKLSILMVVGIMLLPADFAFATGTDRELTDREKAAFIVRDEWTTWVKAFTASLSELDKNATSRIYENMDYYDMQYRFTEKYKKVPEYLDEDGKPTQKLRDMIKKKRKEISGAKAIDYLCFTSQANGSTVGYTKTGSLPALYGQIGISYDGVSFTSWDGSPVTINLDESVWVINKATTLSTSTSNYFKFNLTGTIEASGDVSSMINFGTPTNYCFYRLFDTQTALTALPEVPLITTAEGCCAFMFNRCTNAKIGPSVLPASSVGQNAYSSMFYGCTQLENAPAIPATTIGRAGCQSMFSDCDALKVAPELPATNLVRDCYQDMFNGCNELVTAPSVLPATTAPISAYSQMFKNCPKLKKSPAIKVKTVSGDSFSNMFNGCTVLNEIYMDNYKGNFGEADFNQWVSGVASTGLFYYSGTETGTGTSKIPVGWTIKPPLTL